MTSIPSIGGVEIQSPSCLTTQEPGYTWPDTNATSIQLTQVSCPRTQHNDPGQGQDI